MKKLYLILLILIINHNQVFSQDLEPTEQTYTIDYDNNSVTTRLDPQSNSYFSQKRFIKSWHWGADYLVNQVLNSNGFDLNSMALTTGKYDGNNNPIPETYLNDKSNLFLRLWEYGQSALYTHCLDQEAILEVRSVQYEPTLFINSTLAERYELQKRDNDPTNSVFGFKTINVNIDANDTKLNLNYTPANQTTGDIVLADPWPDNIMYYNTSSFKDENNETHQNLERDRIERRYLSKEVYSKQIKAGQIVRVPTNLGILFSILCNNPIN